MLTSFRDSADVRFNVGVVVAFFVIAGIGAIVVAPACGIAMIVVEVLLLVWLNVFAGRNFGGMSGDVAGFFLQVCELLLLLSFMVASKAVGL